jgi:hypothetical protein
MVRSEGRGRLAKYRPFSFSLAPATAGIAMELLAVLSAAFALFVQVFFMRIAWRAMRAHDEIAEALLHRNEP